jgi:hypothetical protein
VNDELNELPITRVELNCYNNVWDNINDIYVLISNNEFDQATLKTEELRKNILLLWAVIEQMEQEV